MSLRRYCLTLDLKDDPRLISEYKRQHRQLRPEILKSIRDAGVEVMEIYRLGTRMCMVMEVNDSFSFERKAEMDRNNPAVQEWERFVWQFQKPLPEAKPGEKWLLMEKIFDMGAQTGDTSK